MRLAISFLSELGIDNSLDNPILYPDKTFENVLYIVWNDNAGHAESV
jgi:hypothetical protein